MEDLGRASEMNPGQLAVIEHLVRDLRRTAADHVDHARRHARLQQELHQEMADQQRLGRGFEDDGVAHEHRGGGQVARNRGEVEGADRKDESLERPILEAVPRGAVVVGLVAQELIAEKCVEAPEVDRLACGIDLRLVHGFRLAEHRRRIDRVAPRPGQQRGRAKQDSRTLVVLRGGPHLPRGERGVDRVVHVLGPADRVLGNRQLMSVGRADVAARAAPTPFAADLHGHLGARICELSQSCLEGLAVRIAWCVRTHSFVGGLRDLEMSVGGHVAISPSFAALVYSSTRIDDGR